MAKDIQIGSVFTAIGFKVDTKDLNSLQQRLGNFKKQLKTLKQSTSIDLNLKGESAKISSARKELLKFNSELKRTKKDQGKFNLKNFDALQRRLAQLKKQLQSIQKLGPIKITTTGLGEVHGLTSAVNKLNEALAKTKSIKASVGSMPSAGRVPSTGAGRFGFGVGSGAAIGSQLGQFAPGVGAIGATFFAGQSVLKAGQEMEGVRAGLTAAAGSVKEGQEAFQFMIDLSDKLGISFKDNVRAYQNFLASAKGVNFTTQQSEQVFGSFAAAGRTLNLSTADLNGIMRATTQILSKGTVQAEELRGQLGERLPGAVSLMAKALGVSVKELNKMLEQGQVLSKDALPKMAEKVLEFAKSNGALERATNSNMANMERLNNAFFFFKVRIAESGFMDRLTSIFIKYTKALGDTGEEADTFSGILTLLVEFVDAVISNIANLIDIFKQLSPEIQAVVGIILLAVSPIARISSLIFFIVGGLEKLLPILKDIIPHLEDWQKVALSLAAGLGVLLAVMVKMRGINIFAKSVAGANALKGMLSMGKLGALLGGVGLAGTLGYAAGTDIYNAVKDNETFINWSDSIFETLLGEKAKVMQRVAGDRAVQNFTQANPEFKLILENNSDLKASIASEAM